MKTSRLVSLALGVSALLLGAAVESSASTCTWTGGGVDANWSTIANWTNCNGAAPVNGDTVVFPAAALRPVNTNDISSLTLSDIQITGRGAGPVSYHLSGQAITLSGATALAVSAGAILDRTRIDMNLAISGDTSFTATAETDIYGDVNLSNHTLTLSSQGSFALYGQISGTGGLIKSGSGGVQLHGNNTFSGTVSAVGGTLWAMHANALGATTSGTTIGSTSTLVVGDYSQTMTLAAEPLTINGGTIGTDSNFTSTVFPGNINLTAASHFHPGSPLTLSGTISGSTLAMDGGVTTFVGILSGPNTHSGTTIANGSGTLYVNGNQPTSPVTTNADTVLGGTGTIGAVAAHGHLRPGMSPGLLTTGDFSGTFGSIDFELNGTTRGSSYDAINVTGAVDLTADSLNIILNFTPAAGTQFLLIDNDGSDAVTSTFNDLAEGATFTAGGTTFQITYVGGTGGNDVVITALTSVPALPTGWLLTLTALLVGAGVFMLGRNKGIGAAGVA